jgi:hypothetical protein
MSGEGMGNSSRADELRYDLACNRARGLLTLTKQRPPVNGRPLDHRHCSLREWSGTSG